jgi:hypothetical protein
MKTIQRLNQRQRFYLDKKLKDFVAKIKSITNIPFVEKIYGELREKFIYELMTEFNVAKDEIEFIVNFRIAENSTISLESLEAYLAAFPPKCVLSGQNVCFDDNKPSFATFRLVMEDSCAYYHPDFVRVITKSPLIQIDNQKRFYIGILVGFLTPKLSITVPSFQGSQQLFTEVLCLEIGNSKIPEDVIEHRMIILFEVSDLNQPMKVGKEIKEGEPEKTFLVISQGNKVKLS